MNCERKQFKQNFKEMNCEREQFKQNFKEMNVNVNIINRYSKK